MALAMTTDLVRATYENVESRYLSTESSSSKRSFTGQPPCVGLYWTPKGQDPEVGYMLVHPAVDFSEHYLAAPLASRGFGVLGYGTRYRAMEEKFVLESALDDIAAGTKWLVENTGIKKLVLIGTSGGGALMAAYQARAQQDSSLRGGDAFVFLNAHPGRADVLTDWLDPSVLDESDPTKRDPSLDMYNPVNGPPYAPEFQARYRAAQRQRNKRITEWAKNELKRLNEAGISDRLFSVDRASADLRFMDPTIDPSDRPSPACFQGHPQKANNGVGFLARATTLETWLSIWSLEDSQSRFEHQAAKILLPTIVIQATGDVGVFPSQAREIFAMIGSKQKELEWVPGAHCFEDSKESVENVADLIFEWTKKTLTV